MTNILQNAALDYSAAGFATLPVNIAKRPTLGAWVHYQKTKPTGSEISNWFNGTKSETTGVAIIAGKVSGNLEILDIDCKYDLTGSLMEDFCSLVKEHLPQLFPKLVIAKTVNNGFHVLFRAPAECVQGNKKIASRPATGDEVTSGDKEKVLIETRGEGGYIVAAPTVGYEWTQGTFKETPLITARDRETLFTIARSFDQMPVKAAPEEKASNRTSFSELSPFDDYNARADIPALLESNGWRFVYQRGENHHYKRPGTTDSVTSASFHNGLKLFYVFSTSTEFESGRGFNPVGVYTQLEHGGDFSAASKALYAAGYGSRHQRKDQTDAPDEFTSGPDQQTEKLNSLNSLNSQPRENEKRIEVPALSDVALHGLAGDTVRKIEPHTESDNAALLVQLLSAFGIVINKGAYFRAEADHHYTKINAVMVGMSSKGRKGSSWGQVSKLMTRADESFLNCVQDGLSSGEGLIYHVRDPQEKETPIKEKGRITGYQLEVIDSGAKEKRVLVLEPEFSRVLRAMQREGNTLSSVIRQAWDSDRLRVMTKTPITASEAHIAIIGHITQEELRRNLDETETANGFANRFVWVFTRRSKFLPEGGNLKESDLNDEVARLRQAISFAANVGELKRDEEARKLWIDKYEKLSSGASGLLGSVTSRAEAQVMRMASIYALLDCSSIIKKVHLDAALALWQYCEDSARYIFGAATGDKVADDIITALEGSGDEGLDRTQISSLFQRHKTSGQINTALRSLLESGRITRFEEKTSGRSREVFKLLRREKSEKSEKSNETQKASGSEISEISEISEPCLHCGEDIPPSSETCILCGGAQLPSFG
jgi:hypothetical protein